MIDHFPRKLNIQQNIPVVLQQQQQHTPVMMCTQILSLPRGGRETFQKTLSSSNSHQSSDIPVTFNKQKLYS